MLVEGAACCQPCSPWCPQEAALRSSRGWTWLQEGNGGEACEVHRGCDPLSMRAECVCCARTPSSPSPTAPGADGRALPGPVPGPHLHSRGPTSPPPSGQERPGSMQGPLNAH